MGSSTPVKTHYRDEVYIVSPHTIKIKFYSENFSWSKTVKFYWPFILIVIPLIPFAFFNSTQKENYNKTFPVLFIVFFMVCLLLVVIMGLLYSWIDLLVFDLENQTIEKGRYRTTHPSKEQIEESIPFANVKSIEINQTENELPSTPPYTNLNLQMTLFSSELVYIILHFPGSGKLQSLTYSQWNEFFQNVIKSSPATTTDEITKDYAIEKVTLSYYSDKSK